MVKISLIVPVYNVEEYLDDCLNSLINQTLKDIEIICIDDESTDNSLEVLKSFARKDKRVKVFSCNHGGLGISRNRGIKKATGEYIAFIDSDDWMELDFCEKVYDNAIKNNSDIVLFNMIEEYEDHQRKRIYFPKDSIDSSFNIKNNQDLLFNNYLTVTSKLHRTEFVKENNIEFLPFLFEDIAFHVESCLKAKRISYHPSIFYHYRKTNSTSIMSDLKENECFCIIDNMNFVEKVLRDSGCYETFEINFLKLKIRQFKEKLDATSLPFKGEFIKLIKNEFMKLEVNDFILNRFPDDVISFYNAIINSDNYWEIMLTKAVDDSDYILQDNSIFTLNGDFFKLNESFNEYDDFNNELINNIKKDLLNNNFTNLLAYESIVKENLFDWDFFKNENNYSGVDALLYYIYLGFHRISRPTSFFDNVHYNELYGLNDCSLNPFVYYILYGRFEGKDKLNKNINITSVNRRYLNRKIKRLNEDYLIESMDNQPNLIVSLTSFPPRMNNIIYTLYSLFDQSLKPNKIVLFLSEDEFPNKEEDVPPEVLEFKKIGLTIKWCDNLKSFKKLIPALKEYPDDVIVTADDDIYYPNNWLEVLWREYEKFPNNIIANRSRRISFDENGDINSYNQWELSYDSREGSFLNFFTGAGGVLYPPNSLHADVFKVDVFKKICPNADDLWFWAMAVKKNTKIRVPENCNPYLIYVNALKDLNLNNDVSLWVYNQDGGNDFQFNNIIEIYPEIISLLNVNEV